MARNTVAFYIPHINYVGGVETWVYNVARKYNYNFKLYYKWIAPNQLKRLEPLMECHKWNGEFIDCDVLIYTYFNHDVIEHSNAKRVVKFIHSDYRRFNIRVTPHPKTTDIVAVSYLAREGFLQLNKHQNVSVAYNPMIKEPIKKVLRLISATRLTSEKGKGRMITLAKRLNDRGIQFIWLVYTDGDMPDIPNVIVMKPQLDLHHMVADSDYLVQLSDSEAYCYAVVESLMVGTPVVITPFLVKGEIGCNESNSIILEFNQSNVDDVIDQMLNKQFKFTYEPPQSDETYMQLLGGTMKTEPIKKGTKFIVEALPIFAQRNVTDVESGTVRQIGEQWEVTPERLTVLLETNPLKRPLVQVVKRIDPPKKRTKKKGV